MKELSFNETMDKHIPTLMKYVPVVARVHGDHHPEFHEVRQLFDAIAKKAAEAGVEKPELSREFAKLRQITDNYTIPQDTCETYETVYNMLSEIDRAYNPSKGS